MDYSTGQYSDIWSYKYTSSVSKEWSRLAADGVNSRFYVEQFNENIRSIEDVLQGLTTVIQRSDYDTSSSEFSSDAEFAVSNTTQGNTSVGNAQDLLPGSAVEAGTVSQARKYAEAYPMYRRMPAPAGVSGGAAAIVPEGSRFFVIKSFNLENIKASFKHGVWTSTKRGNKRLSKAYVGLPAGARIFLFFSVNKSGKFCGVAEMKSNILQGDSRNKIWQCEAGHQFNDLFLVEWTCVCDVHNRLLKHFNIMDTEGSFKPVTHARDADEVDIEIGRTILKLFTNTKKNRSSFLED
ncbi:ACL161Cp [Eremothecium gossypii ATCC 10895]|uniref:ACL161Cp n=1 Tax=Eremothecium gossypii (strain ATCC 10895 / CBS 109.51 / FGSC 9923 / NRRL Y-1056) TaxID=284811 RepID=Q75CT0_EREGS|nr:ACL161Cp [Eremothecium gossypii ATCC 10895]AAS51067.1 ACL161Cp [Eremothecium gossypii ATCC 10895]AEY95357.1 FACL161Cp [Eremothecium gossypii FDAG1]